MTLSPSELEILTDAVKAEQRGARVRLVATLGGDADVLNVEVNGRRHRVLYIFSFRECFQRLVGLAHEAMAEARKAERKAS